MRWLVLVLVLVGCGGSHSAVTDAPHAVSDGAPDALALVWQSTTVTMQTASIIVEQVSYLGRTGLLLNGEICRPNDAQPHPVIVLDHGGFAGLTTELDGGLCTTLATQGSVVIEASYRGEDGSLGTVEVCLGEVDDVLDMIEIGLAQPYSDPTHLVIEGASHGSCITLRALERGLAVNAASEGFGITDMAADYAYWQQELAGPPDANTTTIQSLVDQLDQSVGGPPSMFPSAYAARSPIGFVSSLPTSLPLMLAHGTADPLVAMAQSCAMVKAIGGGEFKAYHLDATQTVTTTAPAGCDAGVTWLAGPLPTTWPDSRYFLIYDGVGHEFTSAGGMAMAYDLVTFVLAKRLNGVRWT